MMVKYFPDYWDAPSRLLQLDGGCGVITAWGILKHLRKRISAARLIKSCRYTKKHGTFSIALAVALREHGLGVKFFSDPDPNPNAIERRCYRIAQEVGIQIHSAISLKSLLAQIGEGSIPVVSYGTNDDSAHLTPLLGIESGKLILPYADDVVMPTKEFLFRWNEPEIFRQCVVAYL